MKYKYKKQNGGSINDISIKGYKDTSPYKDASKLNINSPNGLITMNGVSKDLIGIDEYGNQQYMKANSGNYQFQGKNITEIPVKQYGGRFKKPNVEQKSSTLSVEKKQQILKDNINKDSSYYQQEQKRPIDYIVNTAIGMAEPFGTIKDVYDIVNSKNRSELKSNVVGAMIPFVGSKVLTDLFNEPVFKKYYNYHNLNEDKTKKLYELYGDDFMNKWDKVGNKDIDELYAKDKLNKDVELGKRKMNNEVYNNLTGKWEKKMQNGGCLECNKKLVNYNRFKKENGGTINPQMIQSLLGGGGGMSGIGDIANNGTGQVNKDLSTGSKELDAISKTNIMGMNGSVPIQALKLANNWDKMNNEEKVKV